MIFHVEYERSIPECKPEGHMPAAPRNSLRWTKPITAIVCDYFAIQCLELSWDEQAAFFVMARASFGDIDGPDSHEIMRTQNEHGLTNAVIVGYWTDAVKHARWSYKSTLIRWLRDEARLMGEQGAWRETIVVPYDRHETIYSEPWYRIGVGRTLDSVIVPIATNGFFGAARDRLPISAIDRLESPCGEEAPKAAPVAGRGQRLFVSTPVNMVTLRSGQYWAHAGQEQCDDYINNMRPRLMTGMNYLVDHKQETGTLSLLVHTNLNDDGTERKETSVVAHFLSLKHLENWAKSHKTHLDIYRHAIAMNRKYKADREFVSWHELFVVQSARFEYVNCHPATGLLPYFDAVIVSQS